MNTCCDLRLYLKPATLALGLALQFSTGGLAYAQEQAVEEPVVQDSVEEEVFDLESFTVTGSLIPRSETAGEAIPIPVDIVSLEDIEASGYSTAAELLQNISVNNGGSVPIANNATGFTPSASSVSLRALGPGSTLVLLNGRRLAPFPTGSGGTVAFVDLNSIPLSAVERFEVLKDGASATYGADAVAGVINIVLKSDFVGSEVSLRYGNTTASTDSSEFNFNVITGFSTENTEVTLVANYFNREAIFAADRDYTLKAPFRSTNSSPGNFDISPDAAYEALIEAGISEGDALTDRVGRPTSDQARDGYLEWKGHVGLRWIFHNLVVNVIGIYTDSFSDVELVEVPISETFSDLVPIEREVEDQLTWNINAAYELFGDSDAWYRNATIRVGVDNVFDTDPPYASGWGSNPSGYPDFLYNSEGRFFWLELVKEF